jgi:hypothetical protein
MIDVSPKAVLVVCSDRAMQEALRRIVAAAGCHPLLAGTVDIARRLRAEQIPVLVLADPQLAVECSSVLGDGVCPIVAVPVRTSSTGVRRLAKRSDAAVRWLTGLVADRCSVATRTVAG